MLSVPRQRRLAAGIQRRFATLARKEGQGHCRQARRDHAEGNEVLAAFHRTECRRDFEWVRKRTRSAGQLSRKR